LTIFLYDLGQFGTDDSPLNFLVRENSFEFSDLQFNFSSLVHDFLTLEGCESTKLKVENRHRLNLVQDKQLDESFFRFVHRGGLANERDDSIERVESLEVTTQNVCVRFRLVEAALGQTDQLLGMALKEGFMPIPWALGSSRGRARLKKALPPDRYAKLGELYRVAMAARGNFESKATINASMRVRKASHLLLGRSAHFVQELIQPRKRKTDP
jgi:hypothetical protein